MLNRFKVYSVEQIISLLHLEPYGWNFKQGKVKVKKIRVDLGGFQVCVNSLRLVTFKTKGIVCKSCGVAGSFFAIEQGPSQIIPHLNLYAVREGLEILITHDHILPLSKGGVNNLSNTQTMCAPCNFKKGV